MLFNVLLRYFWRNYSSLVFMLALMDEGVTAASITAVQGISTDVSPLLPAPGGGARAGAGIPRWQVRDRSGGQIAPCDWTIFKRRV